MAHVVPGRATYPGLPVVHDCMSVSFHEESMWHELLWDTACCDRGETCTYTQTQVEPKLVLLHSCSKEHMFISGKLMFVRAVDL